MTDYKLHLSDSVEAYDDLKYKSTEPKSTGGKKTVAEGKVGTELHMKSGTLQKRRRQIDHRNDSYEEEIHNPATNTHIIKKEKLSKHRGHGSDRKQPDVDH